MASIAAAAAVVVAVAAAVAAAGAAVGAAAVAAAVRFLMQVSSFMHTDFAPLSNLVSNVTNRVIILS